MKAYRSSRGARRHTSMRAGSEPVPGGPLVLGLPWMTRQEEYRAHHGSGVKRQMRHTHAARPHSFPPGMSR